MKIVFTTSSYANSQSCIHATNNFCNHAICFMNNMHLIMFHEEYAFDIRGNELAP